MWNLIFLITCLLFSLLLFVLFESKQHINNVENSIFRKINITTSVTVFLEILLQILTYTLGGDNQFTIFFQRLYLIGISAWFTIFSIYAFYIMLPRYSNDKTQKKYHLLRTIHIIVFLVTTILYLFLKINYFYSNDAMYTFGPATDLLKINIGTYIGIWVIISLIGYKRIFRKKYIPVLAVYLLVGINLVLQSINPTLLIVSLTLTFVLYLMYFTIENPDLKMINELYKNKNIMEQTYVDKSNFLFEMTQEVRMPIAKIHELCNALSESKNLKDYQESIKLIDNYSKELDYIINDILNVNSIDIQNIKFIDNKYQLTVIYDEITKKIKSVLPENVKLNANIIKSIPDLYGDSIKLKQIIYSLLMYSIKRTQSGYIDFNINAIEKYDLIRLIITIKDSGDNISIDKINEILSTTGALNPEDIDLMNKSEMSIELCQKVIKLLGGNLLVRSDETGGEIILTIDQKIANKESNLIANYPNVNDSKMIVVVNQDKELNKKIKELYREYNNEVICLLNGNDLIDNIKLGKKYDYIIVANEMKVINGFSILKELQKTDNFNIPIIMMIGDNEKLLKDELIKDGFSDVIESSKIIEEIKRIEQKY